MNNRHTWSWYFWQTGLIALLAFAVGFAIGVLW